MSKLKSKSEVPHFAELPVVTREAPIASVNADDRTIEVIWTKGAIVKRYDWRSGEIYNEDLVVSSKAVRLERLNSGGPVLDNHKAYGSVGDMLAVVERAWIDKGEGRAIIRFPKAEDDQEADKVFRKIKDGIITRLSCGYRCFKIEVDKTKTPKVWRVVDWEPFEISFVLVAADINAKVRNDDVTKYRCEFVGDDQRASRSAIVRMRMAAKSIGLK